MKNKKLIKLLIELADNPEVKSITVNWTIITTAGITTSCPSEDHIKPIITIIKK